MRKNGLGRGLDALLPDEAALPLEGAGDAVEQIPLARIDPNREQPRKHFDPEALERLAESIRHAGVLQPLILAPEGGRYTIIAGERRFRAARLAGLTHVPAILRDWDEVRRREAALVENIQRENLDPIEEAEGVRSLMDECGLTQEAAAARLGKSRPAIANLLRLLSLPREMKRAIAEGALSAGHARVLCGVLEAARRQQLFERTLSEGWSVRRLEQEAQAKARPAKRPSPVALPDEYDQLVQRVQQATGLRAQLSGGPEKGRIILSYTSAEELQRLWDLLGE